MPDALIAAFSQRSADIEAAVDTAIAEQVLRTGRRPDANAVNRIRQHLTLATRDRKHAPNLAESVEQWRTTAARVLDQDPTTWAAAVTAVAGASRSLLRQRRPGRRWTRRRSRCASSTPSPPPGRRGPGGT